MPRFTKIETEALGAVINDILAGDAREFFNNGCAVDDPPKTKEHKHAARLADALASASLKLRTY